MEDRKLKYVKILRSILFANTIISVITTVFILGCRKRVKPSKSIYYVYEKPKKEKSCDQITTNIQTCYFQLILISLLIRYSSVRVAMSYGIDGRGSIPGRGKKISLLHSIQTGSGGPPSLLYSKYRSLFPRV
jgi:hypothetical protein